jgi:hypothetical protein
MMIWQVKPISKEAGLRIIGGLVMPGKQIIPEPKSHNTSQVRYEN